MSEDFNFSLEEQTFPLSIASQKYLIVEASEDAAKRYKNAAMRATKFSDKGKPSGVDGLADVEPFLVSMCLFKVDDAGKREPVQLSTILKWPHRVVEPIYQKVRELSGLKDDENGPLIEILEKRIERETDARAKEVLGLWLAELKDTGDLGKNSQTATTTG